MQMKQNGKIEKAKRYAEQPQRITFHHFVAEFTTYLIRRRHYGQHAPIIDAVVIQVQPGGEKMIVLEEKLHRLREVAAGHEGLSQQRMGAKVEAHTEFQSERGITGEGLRVGNQLPEIRVADARADAGDSFPGEVGAA